MELETATRLTDLERRESVSEHRLKDVEEQQKRIYDLTISVKELAMSVKSMTEEQARQSKEIERQAERVRNIEERPDKEKADLVDSLARYILTALAGAVIALVFFKTTGFHL